MKKIIILVALVLSSCATRKVNVDKVDSVVKTDSVYVEKKEVVTTQENNVSVITCTDELELTPIDTTKAILVDGKEYKNVFLKYKKTKVVLLDTTKIKVSEKASIEVNLKKESSVKTFKKEVKRKSNYLGWILILLLVALGVYTYKKINKTLF